MLKQNKAITLIALIITIIVLLILAGVVINMTLGNDGIIAKAQAATNVYQNAQENEQTELAKMENEVDSYIFEDRSSKSLEYSIDPKIVGTWTDGSPIYQKTIFTNTPSTADTDIMVASIPDLKICICIEGNTDGESGQNNPINWYFNTNIYISTYVDVNNGEIRQKCSSGYINKPEHITIQYLKKNTNSTNNTN